MNKRQDNMNLAWFRHIVAVASLVTYVGCTNPSGTGPTDALEASVPQAKLVNVLGATGDRFGRSVAIDGGTILAGDIFGGPGGAVFTFQHSGTNAWDATGTIATNDTAPGDFFGDSVAIDGEYAIVGASLANRGEPTADGQNAGAAYLFRRTGATTWDGGFKIEAPLADLQAAGDQFGWSVDISGDYAIVGAPLADIAGQDSGAAWIFRRTGENTWGNPQALLPSDVGANERFGASVAIDGDFAVVGAPAAEIAGAGRAWIFRLTAVQVTPQLVLDSWTEDIVELSPAGAPGDRFGAAVAIDGTALAVGASGTQSGTVFTYRRNGSANQWEADGVLLNPGAVENRFGESVAINGDALLVGASGGSSAMGAAWLYRRQGASGWAAPIEFVAQDGKPADLFGEAVALSSSHAIAGALGADGPTLPLTGAAYVELY